MQGTDDIATDISVLRLQHRQLENTIKALNDRIGTLECLNIMYSHFKIRSIEQRITDLTAAFATLHIATKPLLVVANQANETFNIKLTRVDRLIAGEYLTIEDLYRSLDSNTASVLTKNMNALEEQLIANSIRVYKELDTNFRNTNKGKRFLGLNKSTKADFLYYYEADKKHTLRFVAEKVVELNT